MTTTQPDHDLPVEEQTSELRAEGGAELPAGDTPTEETGDVSSDVPDTAGDVGTLCWVDPASLILGPNVRGEVVLDRHFVRDIADRGVREPIVVRRRAGDDALIVRKGKRRTLAALENGLARVRVFIEPDPDADTDDRAGQIDRIIDQLGENTHRAGNTDAEEVRAHQELLDLGLSAAQIARRTHTPTARVRATTTVARSALATAVLERYDLTLDQVGVIAEFDDQTEEGTEAVKLLTVTAQRDAAQFSHVAQRLRNDREDRRLHTAAAAEFADAGVRVLPTDPDTDPDTDGEAEGGETFENAQPVSGLRPTAADADGTKLTDEAHTGCPGHAVRISVHRRWGDEPRVVSTVVCTDPDGNGHAPRWSRSAGGSGARQPGPMSEQEKAERRSTIGNNKAWDAAVIVRKDWLTGFLTRKSAPKDAQHYIVTVLARGSHDVRKAMERAHPTACALLGLPEPAGWYSGKPNSIGEAADKAPAARLPVLTLAVLLGAAEEGTSRNSWRSPTGDTRAYFTALREWGYDLSPVEQLVLADPTASDSDSPAEDDPAGDVEEGKGDPADAIEEEKAGDGAAGAA